MIVYRSKHLYFLLVIENFIIGFLLNVTHYKVLTKFEVEYISSLDCVNSIRDKLSRDCSVVLEDIAGVTNARYQTYVSPTISAPTVSMNAIVDEVSTYVHSGFTMK